MRRTRRIVTVGLTSLALGCGGGRGPEWPTDGSLTVGLGAAPLNFDPRIGSDEGSTRLFELMLDGLLVRGADTGLHPALAESWEILDDGYRWRFHLRRGVVFHDGRSFGAEDVVWTLQTILDGTVPTPKLGALPALERVSAVDSHTVDFELREPFGALLAELTSGLSILPRGTTPEEMNQRPIGTGAYRFAGRTADTVTLEPFAGHWRGAPSLTRLILREVPDATVRVLELRRGSVQMVINDLPPDSVPTFRADPSYQVPESPGSSFGYLGFNLEDPILRDRRVRRAIAHGIDRERLVATIWRGLGTVAETIFPKGLWARHDGLAPIRHDPEAARRLLDEAGYPDPDGAGPRARLEVTFKTSTQEISVLQATVIQAMLAEIGIDIEVRSYEFATFYEDVRRGNFQMFTLTRTAAVEPNLYRLILHSSSIPPAGQNRGRYRNREFDRLIEEAARLHDPAQRRPLYLRAQEIFAEDLPYVILISRKNVAVMPRHLKGYRHYPSGEFTALREVRWSTSAAPAGGG